MLACTAVLLAGAGCEAPPRPWQAAPDGGVIDESRPYLPARQDTPLLGDASVSGLGSSEPDDAGPIGDVEPARQPRREGGLWSGCHAGFAPPAEPLAGVTRLGLLCGPVNGMQRKGRVFQGQVLDDAPERNRHTIRVVADRCYRVMAVASPEVVDLDVTVSSSRGSRVAADSQTGRWVVIDPDRPFCTFSDDEFSLQVRSREGSGRYALEVWELR